MAQGQGRYPTKAEHEAMQHALRVGLKPNSYAEALTLRPVVEAFEPVDSLPSDAQPVDAARIMIADGQVLTGNVWARWDGAVMTYYVRRDSALWRVQIDYVGVSHDD